MRHQVGQIGALALVLARMGAVALRRIDRPRQQQVDAQTGQHLPFVGRHLGQVRQAGVGSTETAPVGGRMQGMMLADEQHRRVRRLLQQRQAGAGQRERRHGVDPILVHPLFYGLVGQRRQCIEMRGAVRDAVQAPELPLDGQRQLVELVLARVQQVKRHRRRLRPAGRHDFIVDLLQPLDAAREQHRGGAVAGESQRGFASYALRGAGDQDHAPCQRVLGKFGLHRHGSIPKSCNAAAAAATPLRAAPSSVAG
ncbi:Uncharacterised protein [Chromobacterium violaceum]|uniref:Uncharacterized protein n=1 Tax=Chromobacterium violaceum TaxID=536 RepID=A0A447TG00_CHRVL|nr:Uncharacterised protein [Chromobacterium violaceum]